MPTCEYCGDHFPKGGAHSTHERNCDERPDPESDDVDESAPIVEEDVTEPTADDDRSDGGSENVLEFEASEFEGVIETVRQTAHSEGVEEGYEVGKSEPAPERDTATTDTDAGDSEPVRPDTCPSCGGEIQDAEGLPDELEIAASRDAGVAAFLEANEGADPEYACVNLDSCGYYVENGDARHFSTPVASGGSAGWGTVIIGGLLAFGVMVLGVLGRQNETQDSGGPDVF